VRVRARVRARARTRVRVRARASARDGARGRVRVRVSVRARARVRDRVRVWARVACCVKGRVAPLHQLCALEPRPRPALAVMVTRDRVHDDVLLRPLQHVPARVRVGVGVRVQCMRTVHTCIILVVLDMISADMTTGGNLHVHAQAQHISLGAPQVRLVVRVDRLCNVRVADG